MYCDTRHNHYSLFLRTPFTKLLLIFTFIISTVVPSAVAQTCEGISDDAECQALYALYNSTNGSNWKDNTNWLSTEPVSNWVGIGVEGGHVTWLALPYNRLIGSIPPELGNLTSLEDLKLYDNKLTGEIPPELGNMTSLEALWLTDNNLTGEIPPELENLTSLGFLLLDRNILTGEIPPELGNLTSLKSLFLSFNELTGSIPPELENLTSLEALKLSFNGLTGFIPPELCNLANLEVLWLSDNNLTGEIPPELCNLANLEKLFLIYNGLTGSIPPELGNLANLEQLNLAYNNLTGEIPPELGNLTSLTSLCLSANKLVGSIPPELGNLTNLDEFILPYNNLTGSIPPELGNLVNPWIINLQFNNLTGSIPPELGNVDVGTLYLSCNNLSGDLPAFLATSFNTLDLSWNCLYASDPTVLAVVEAMHSGHFLDTQTIEPENVTAETTEASGTQENRVRVTWDPILYTNNEGGYKVYYRQMGNPDYSYYGMTADKDDSELTVANLEPGIEYEFRVNTVTWAHSNNNNDLQSPDSDTASALSGTLSRAFIPVWKQAPGYFTGVVVSNFGDSDFNVDLAAYDSVGGLEPLGQNPASSSLEAGLQNSLLGNEFFHGDPYHEDFSWIELGAENSNRMGSIFLYGASDTQMLDGAEAQSSYAKRLYFTRPLDEGFFDGWNPEIQMCLVNPTDEEVSVTCTIKGYIGESTNSHTIPAKGFIVGDSEDLTNPGHGLYNGFVDVEVTEGPGVVGFSRIEFPGVRTALGMNAVQASSANKMYSAQLAHGLNIVTNLRLVNTSKEYRKITLTAIGDDGSPLADPVHTGINILSIYSADLGTLFGLDDEVVTTGSLVVESNGRGVIGDIIFAEGDTMEYAMSLPLQDRLFKEAVFNHISNLPTVFTGFALYNPGDETASVLIEAFGTDGQKAAEKTLILDPGERIARTLTDPDIWPEFPVQSGGYIKIQSTQPIAGQQLFGDRSLRYMAAVPPTTRVEPMFD